jgi:hypothetical protein
MKKCFSYECDPTFGKLISKKITVCPYCHNDKLVDWTKVLKKWEKLNLEDFEDWCIDEYGSDLTEKILNII